MAVSSTNNRISYVGDGATTAFAYPSRILAAADLVVYVDGTLKAITTDYAVTLAADYGSATCTFTTAPSNGAAIILLVDPTLTQKTDLPTTGPFPSESVERAFDKLTLIAQRLHDKAALSIRAPDSDPTGLTLSLPEVDIRAGKYLAFDVNGSITVTAGTGSASDGSVSIAMAPVVGALSLDAAVVALGVGGYKVSNTVASGFRGFYAQTSGVNRWSFGAWGDTESGSNAGSSFFLNAYTDGGVYIDSPIAITRAAGGSMTIARPVTLSSLATFSAGATFSGTVTLPTGAVGVTQAAGNNSTKLATTAYVDRGASGASMVLLGTADGYNITEAAFTGISASYDRYRLVISMLVPMTNGVAINMQFGQGAGPTWKTASYYWAQTGISSAGTSATSGAAGTDTSIDLVYGNLANNAANRGVGTIEISSLGDTTTTKTLTADFSYNSGTAYIRSVGCGEYNGDTAAITALRLFASSGNIAIKAALYGIRNA